MNDFFKNLGILVALVAGILALIFLYPILAICVGYISGLIIKLCFGGLITNGLNLIFNTNRFTPDHIPMICATLAVLGSYFRAYQYNKDKK